jgi:hypothetical protein
MERGQSPLFHHGQREGPEASGAKRQDAGGSASSAAKRGKACGTFPWPIRLLPQPSIFCLTRRAYCLYCLRLKAYALRVGLIIECVLLTYLSHPVLAPLRGCFRYFSRTRVSGFIASLKPVASTTCSLALIQERSLVPSVPTLLRAKRVSSVF